MVRPETIDLKIDDERYVGRRSQIASSSGANICTGGLDEVSNFAQTPPHPHA
jgi:hypothetical protein